MCFQNLYQNQLDKCSYLHKSPDAITNPAHPEVFAILTLQKASYPFEAFVVKWPDMVSSALLSSRADHLNIARETNTYGILVITNNVL